MNEKTRMKILSALSQYSKAAQKDGTELKMPNPKFVKAFLSLFFIAGLIVSLLGLKNVMDAWSSSKWPSTGGIVTSSRVTSSRHNGHNSYTPRVTYEYEVGGRRYRGNRIFFGHASGIGRPPARFIVKKYHKDAAIRVFYNPKHPGNATLKPGLDLPVFVMLGFGIFFMLLTSIIYKTSKQITSAVKSEPDKTLSSEPVEPVPDADSDWTKYQPAQVSEVVNYRPLLFVAIAVIALAIYFFVSHAGHMSMIPFNRVFQSSKVEKAKRYARKPNNTPAAASWKNHYVSGTKLYRKHLYAKAEQEFKAALNIAEQSKFHDTRLTYTLRYLALLTRRKKEYPEASAMYQRALKYEKDGTYMEKYNKTVTMTNLADTYTEMGKYEEAEKLYLQAMEIQKELPLSYGYTKAYTLTRYAKLLKKLGRVYEAQEYTYKAREITHQLKAKREKR